MGVDSNAVRMKVMNGENILKCYPIEGEGKNKQKFVNLCERCLSMTPNERPSFKEIVNELLHLLMNE